MLKQIKATTPSLRHKIKLNLPVNKLINKQLSIIKKKTGGRNFLGKITTRHIGGGHKQRIKLLDNNIIGLYTQSKVIDFIYDSNRSNYLSLLRTNNNKEYLKLALEGQKLGDIVYGRYFPSKKVYNLGETTFIQNIPIGMKISNIELKPNTGFKLAKAAGVFATIIKHDNNFTTIKLASKKTILIPFDSLCTLGINANINHHNKILGKAGVKRWLGIRPTVRGEAMNPIDHPHGGETSGGVKLKTIYGKIAKFIKTK